MFSTPVGYPLCAGLQVGTNQFSLFCQNLYVWHCKCCIFPPSIHPPVCCQTHKPVCSIQVLLLWWHSSLGRSSGVPSPPLPAAYPSSAMQQKFPPHLLVLVVSCQKKSPALLEKEGPGSMCHTVSGTGGWKVGGRNADEFWQIWPNLFIRNSMHYHTKRGKHCLVILAKTVVHNRIGNIFKTTGYCIDT